VIALREAECCALARTNYRWTQRLPRCAALGGGNHAEVAATHSWCTRDGLHVGRSMVRCGLRAALGVWRLYRPPAPPPLWCTRLHCRGHILRAPPADRAPSQARAVVASASCGAGP